MRVGFDARLMSALGIGRYISGLLPPLAELLQDRLVVISRSADVALVRALTEGRAGLLTSDALPYRIGEQASLLATLLRARLRLVHFPHYNLPLALPGPFVVTIHDLFTYRFPDIHSGLLPRGVNRALIRGAVRRAAAVITPSAATAAEVVAHFPRSSRKVTAIAEGADGRFTSERNPTAERAWHHYLGITPPFFLYLGQWKPYKNVPLLVDAFAQLRAAYPNAQLVVAGDDPRYPEVRAAAARLSPGAVVFPGRLPEDAVPDLYRSATAVMLPSRAEGFGLPVLEAMACGVPVICSDLPVLREIADGVAVFCDAGKAESFAGAMRDALKATIDPERIARGLVRARTFTWARAAQATAEIYERLLVP